MKQKRDQAQECILMSLACGSTVEGAADKAGVSKRTVYRYLEEESFRRKIQLYQVEMLHRALGILSAAGVESVKTILRLLDRDATELVRLAAARAILELGLKLRHVTDLEERMTQIEKALDEQKSRERFQE